MPEQESIHQLQTEIQTLKIKDEFRTKELDALMKKLGETSKTLKEILADTLKDYGIFSIKRLYRKVVLGEAPIRKGRGCFYISVGDGRKKTSEILRIRS